MPCGICGKDGHNRRTHHLHVAPSTRRRLPRRALAANPRAAKTASGGKHKSEKPIECAVCGDSMDEDHINLRCPQGHHYCNECTGVFTRSTLGDGVLGCIPPRCSICKAEISRLVFERQLSQEQTSEYLQYVAAREVTSDEVLCCCPFCNYFEIWKKDESMTFLTCKSQSCSKLSCYHCKLEAPQPDQDGEHDDEGVEEINKHFQHTALAPLKKRFDEAVEVQVSCPNPQCNVKGIKDDACTHMTCDGCGTEWCYMCGLAFDDTDQADEAEMVEFGMDEDEATTAYRHNVNWQKNPARCPMYLSEIADVDDSWPEDDDKCVSHLARLRALRRLRDLQEEVGIDKYAELRNAFTTVANCGYSEADIENARPREQYIRREDSDEAEGENRPAPVSSSAPGGDARTSEEEEEEDAGGHRRARLSSDTESDKGAEEEALPKRRVVRLSSDSEPEDTGELPSAREDSEGETHGLSVSSSEESEDDAPHVVLGLSSESEEREDDAPHAQPSRRLVVLSSDTFQGEEEDEDRPKKRQRTL